MFLSWWAGQLLSIVPPSLRRWRGGSSHAIIARLENIDGQPSIALLARRGRKRTPIGTFPAQAASAAAIRSALSRRGTKARSTLLIINQSAILERKLTLPMAAEANLQSILEHEMDRLSPFAADEVYSSFFVEERDRARDRLSIRLRIVPRDNVVKTLDLLTGFGLQGAAISAQGAPESEAIELAHESPDRLAFHRKTVFALAALCVVLSVAAVSLPFFRMNHRIKSVDGLIASLRPRVEEVDGLRRRAAATAASTDVIAAQRAKVGDALGALAAVTEVLPDDTSLNELTLSQRKLGLQGQSASAARLIAGIAADPVVKNPSFTAPVVRNEGAKTDAFSIQAEVTQ